MEPDRGEASHDRLNHQATNQQRWIQAQRRRSEFRVTVGLGQDSVEVATLERRAAALQEGVAELAGGDGAVVVVDLVKAAAQLVVSVDAGDALAAATEAVKLAGEGLQAAGLDAPGNVVTVEAEAVPAPAQAQVLRPHPAHGAPCQLDAVGITAIGSPTGHQRAFAVTVRVVAAAAPATVVVTRPSGHAYTHANWFAGQ